MGRSVAGSSSTAARISTAVTDPLPHRSPTRCGVSDGVRAGATLACGKGALAAVEHAAANNKTHRTYVRTRKRADTFTRCDPEPEIWVVPTMLFVQSGLGFGYVEPV